jgi:hypothetical protein
MHWPRCDSAHPVPHGCLHHGQAQRTGTDCRRQFVPDTTTKVIPPQTWELMDTPVWEKTPLAGIARATGLAADSLQASGDRQDAAVPRARPRRTPKKGG